MKLNRKNRKVIIEIASALIIVIIINQFFSKDPGFYKINFVPYLTIPIIITVYNGRKLGVLSLFLSILSILLSIHISNLLFYQKSYLSIIKSFMNEFFYIVFANIIIIYVISLIVDQLRERIFKLEKRLKKVSLESLRNKRTTKALQIVNREFESRLSKSQESITTLYDQIEKLGRLNSTFILQTFLETISLFTKTSKATIWSYKEGENKLLLIASIGYYNNEPGPYLKLENSVEGFVYRNNQFFSIRNINEFQSIMMHQAKYNIITTPITIGKRVWGVLNIEELPFEKYSRYSEQLIHIIVNLTEPYLEKALNFERMVKRNDLDSINNLPFYSQFYSLLEDQLKYCWKINSSLSIIIFELVNIKNIIEIHNINDTRKLFADTVISVFKDAGHDFFFFNYKNSNQIVIISTNLDFDGVSYYCVKSFKKFNEAELKIHGVSVNMELCVGYSTQKEVSVTPDSLINQAEALLNMAKL